MNNEEISRMKNDQIRYNYFSRTFYIATLYTHTDSNRKKQNETKAQFQAGEKRTKSEEHSKSANMDHHPLFHFTYLFQYLIVISCLPHVVLIKTFLHV